jgi:predicted hydrocarbon binding protein
MAKRPIKKRAGRSVKASRKAVKRVRHAKKAVRGRKTAFQMPKEPPIAVVESGASDFEEFLLNSLTSDKTGGIYKSIAALDMIYSLTHAGRELGYKSGFLVGSGLCQKSTNGIELLFKGLEMYGLGRVLYFPSSDRVIITANELQRRGHVALGENIHVYESGIIAGFLSAATGQNIIVHESQCVFNNSAFCQFVAEQEFVPQGREKELDRETVVRTIAEVIESQPAGVVDSHTEHAYYLLPLIPLMRKPLADETGRLLYMIGVQLANITFNENPKEVIEKIAYYFDLGSVNVERGSKGKKVIRLKYKQYNSLDNLVRLSASLFVGFLATAFGTKPELEMSNDPDGRYVVKMRIKWDSE